MSADTSPCTVERRCSSAGVICGAEDRACQSGAVARGLEVTCENVAEPRSYVYCPPGAEQRDSSVVWILLIVAFAIATVGGALSLSLLRSRSRAEK